MTDAFVWDLGTPQQRITQPPETERLLAEIEAVFTDSGRHLLYSHKVSGCLLPPACLLRCLQRSTVCQYVNITMHVARSLVTPPPPLPPGPAVAAGRFHHLRQPGGGA